MIAVGARAGALLATESARLIRDERIYVRRAESLLSGEGYLGSYQSWVRHEGGPFGALPQYPGGYQPPGYTTFVAGGLAISGGSVTFVKWIQVLISSMTVLLVYGLAARWFDTRHA